MQKMVKYVLTPKQKAALKKEGFVTLIRKGRKVRVTPSMARNDKKPSHIDPQLERLRQEAVRKGVTDYGADPLGNGKYKMWPSGDIVNEQERSRRLNGGNRATIYNPSGMICNRSWDEINDMQMRRRR